MNTTTKPTPTDAGQRWLLVLGGTSDLGLACANVFAGRGFNVVLAGRRLDALRLAATHLGQRHGVVARAAEFDATALTTHTAFYAALNPKPDVVLCAVGADGDQALAQRDTEALTRAVHTNFLGPAHILGIVAEEFERRGGGTIIGVSSMAGERGKSRNYAYGAAKAGFTAFLSGLRQRLEPAGVLVITVIPGFLATRMTTGMTLPKALTLSADDAARRIYAAYAARRPVTTLSRRWALIRTLIRNLPERLFLKTSL